MPPVVYRLYDADEQLLYIGVTGNVARRFVDHAIRKSWWPEVRSHRLEHFETWREATLAETRAIRCERPIHNVNVGLWRHIVDDIRDGIAAGTLRPGDRLPSTTALAEHYGCGRGTVRQGITILRATGELRGQQGKAVYVTGPSIG